MGRARPGFPAGIDLGQVAAQATLLDAIGAVDALVHRRDALERQIVAMLPGSPWALQAGRLRCLRGVDTLTAAGLCAEIGDFERFARAEQLMSYLGLVPSEHSTGEQAEARFVGTGDDLGLCRTDGPHLYRTTAERRLSVICWRRSTYVAADQRSGRCCMRETFSGARQALQPPRDCLRSHPRQPRPG